MIDWHQFIDGNLPPAAWHRGRWCREPLISGPWPLAAPVQPRSIAPTARG